MRLILRLLKDRTGVAATEFALLVPALLALLVGVIEICNFTLQSRRAQQAASLAAEFMSRDGDNILRVGERHIVEDIWMIVNPTAHNATVPRDGAWANGYSRALASIAFVDEPGCTQDCPLVPLVDWSFLYGDSITNPVSVKCDVTISPDGTRMNGDIVPAGLVGRAPIVLADFTYPYFPLAQGWLFPPIELHVNAVRKTRNGQVLQHEPDGFVDQC